MRVNRPYNVVYHRTLEARPVTVTTSALIYTVFYDTSMGPDDATLERDLAGREPQFI